VVKSQAGGGEPGNRSGQLAGTASVDRDQFWIDLHAFATSPRGLGLALEVFQALSWKEVTAHKRIWAEERALFCNANFSTDGIPYIADDFLGTGNREARKAKEEMSKRAAELANVNLKRMKPGEITEDVPIWAIPMKDRHKVKKLG
jgi:hypothetical protein